MEAPDRSTSPVSDALCKSLIIIGNFRFQHFVRSNFSAHPNTLMPRRICQKAESNEIGADRTRTRTPHAIRSACCPPHLASRSLL